MSNLINGIKEKHYSDDNYTEDEYGFLSNAAATIKKKANIFKEAADLGASGYDKKALLKATARANVHRGKGLTKNDYRLAEASRKFGAATKKGVDVLKSGAKKGVNLISKGLSNTVGRVIPGRSKNIDLGVEYRRRKGINGKAATIANPFSSKNKVPMKPALTNRENPFRNKPVYKEQRMRNPKRLRNDMSNYSDHFDYYMDTDNSLLGATAGAVGLSVLGPEIYKSGKKKVKELGTRLKERSSQLKNKFSKKEY